MNTRITFDIIDGKLVAPIQSEIEQVALELEILDIGLERAELHRNIYFDIIPLTNRYNLIFDKELNGWLLRYELES